MSKAKQFNRLSRLAKEGCQESKNQLIVIFMGMVERESDAMWYKVKDVTAFEQECHHRLARALEELPNLTFSYTTRLVKRTAGDHVKNRSYGRKQLFSLDALAGENEEGSNQEFPLHDVLADVESEVIVKEIAVLLAEDDQRKLATLNFWKDGLNNDSRISELLAYRFGGNAKSHRIFVQRFRSHCQKQLATAV